MKPLPSTIERFVEAQQTIAISELDDGDVEVGDSPYGVYWYRAIAAMLLSGRVAVTSSRLPNRTDINRICKEANFHPILFERTAIFFLAARVVGTDCGRFVQGENHDSFWKHRPKDVTKIARAAVVQLIQNESGSFAWRPTMAMHAKLPEFLILFFTCFRGKAIREDQLGKTIYDFSRLPEADLKKLAANVGLKNNDVSLYDWQHWLDETGQRELLSALYMADLAYYEERQKVRFIIPSALGLGILGLGPVPKAPVLAKTIQADSNLAIFAGAGLEFDVLTPLFRFCKIKRIDQVFEFKVDPKRLREIPTASAELRAALANLDPLPTSLVAALKTKSPLGGKIGFRYCSALVKPATPEALTAIRQHPQLKGYLESRSPPDYLVVKQSADPVNFLHRCQSLGFEIEPL